MVDLIIKVLNNYHRIEEYIINPKTGSVYKKHTGKLMKTYNPNGKPYNYQYIKGQYYRPENLIKWANEYLEGKIQPIEKSMFIRKCRKCGIQTDQFLTLKSRVCNTCLIRKPKNLNEDYKTVDRFLYKLKAKNWQATYLDLFELINCFDIYYPNMVISTELDEDTSIKLLLRIIKKHKKVRAGLIKI